MAAGVIRKRVKAMSEAMLESCANCAYSYSLEKLDYINGFECTKLEGHICMVFADEGKAMWMVGADDGMCEGYFPKEVR